MPRITVPYAKNIIRRALREIADPSPGSDQLELAWEHFRSSCAYCGVRLTMGSKDAHLDHLVSAARGGRNHISNRALCCSTCNEKEKLDRPWEEFLRCKTDSAPEYQERLQRIRDWISIRSPEAELLSDSDAKLVDELAGEVNAFFQTRVDQVRQLRARDGLPRLVRQTSLRYATTSSVRHTLRLRTGPILPGIVQRRERCPMQTDLTHRKRSASAFGERLLRSAVAGFGPSSRSW